MIQLTMKDDIGPVLWATLLLIKNELREDWKQMITSLISSLESAIPEEELESIVKDELRWH